MLGRHSERHTGSVTRALYVPDTRRGSRGGSRKENEQVYVTCLVILVCSSRGRDNGNHEQGRHGLPERPSKAHYTKHRRPPRERLPFPATFHVNPTLQCSRCLGYLRPTNALRVKCSRSSVLERVRQAMVGDDRGCSSIFVFIPTDFRCGATF